MRLRHYGLGYIILAVSFSLPAFADYDFSLRNIPSTAELVCVKPVPSEAPFAKNPPVEIFASNSEGILPVQITRDKTYYNHVAVSPGRRYIGAECFCSGDTNHDGKVDLNDRDTLVVIDTVTKRVSQPVPQAQGGGIGGVDFTPDGQYIITTLLFNGIHNIYRLRPDGSELVNLTAHVSRLLGDGDTPVWVSDASVSFDGQWITFIYIKGGTYPRIARMKIDGTQANFVTDPKKGTGHGETFPPGDYDPEFDPTGQWIVFQRSTGQVIYGKQPVFDVYKARVNGTDLTQVSPRYNNTQLGITDWSRDNRIVITEFDQLENFTGPIITKPNGTDYHRVWGLKECLNSRWIGSIGE